MWPGRARADSAALPRGARRLGPGLICGLAALLLYAATCAPGVEWQDSGVHQFRILTGRLDHPRGLALSHPLHYWLGRAALLVPIGEPARRLNLMSAVAGAVGVGLLATCVWRVTRSRAAAYLAAAVLSVAHSYWQMSVITETYTLAAALMTLEWYLLLRYAATNRPTWLLALCAVNGLHVADHLLGLLTLVTYAGLLLERLVRRRIAWRWVAACAGIWFVAASPYWTLVIRHYAHTGALWATLRSAFFGGSAPGDNWSGAVFNVRLTWEQVKLAALTLGYNFPSLALPVALAGLLRDAHGRQRVFRRVLLAQTLIIGVFVARYEIVDLYTFFVPVCVLVALWFGVGVDRLASGLRRETAPPWLLGAMAANAVLPLIVYWVFPVVAEQRQWLRSRLRDLPYRNEYAYFFRPWRMNDDSASNYARAALERTGAGGWLLGDNTTAYTIAYTYIVHGGPGGIRVYSGRSCLNVPAWPGLADDELAAFVRAGGRAVLIPGGTAEGLWSGRFALDRADPAFWLICPEGGGQGRSDRIDYSAPGDRGP